MTNSATPNTLEDTPYRHGLHLMAMGVTVFTFLVICVGGTTKSKEAGLTIPEPVIFNWVAEWLVTENISAEYGHRIIAFMLSCLIATLTGWVLFVEKRPAVRKLAIGALLAVIAQAVLGALTVKFFAHAKTSIPHAVLGQITFCIAASLAVVTSAQWMAPTKAVISNEQPALRRLTISLVATLFVQLLLGAALRHDDKAHALRDGHESIFIWHLAAHILGALAVTYFLARVLMSVFRQHREQKEILGPARLIMMLLGVQLSLGIGAAILKVMTRSYDAANSPPPLRVWVATSHVAGGALMLALSVVLALKAYRYTESNGKSTLKYNEHSTGRLGVPA